MAALARIGRNTAMMKTVKYAITIGALAITFAGSLALNDERANSHEAVSLSISEQVIDGVRDMMSPLVVWLAESEESPACSPRASASR